MAGPHSDPPELPGFTYRDWLGSGGFADVFSYSQDHMGREVAVKVLLSDLGPEATSLFASEINLMAKLSSHPAIVSVFQAGVASDGRPFLVMEQCPPPTLRGKISPKPMTIEKTLEIGIQIASAVETAHRLGVIHRDIKPSNILFTEYGRAALTDFGISIPADAIPGAETAYTVAWAPPEQIHNESLGPATDIYSLSGTLWAMLSGHSPFHVPRGDNSYDAVEARNLNGEVPQLRRAGVPQNLERLILRGLNQNPDKRPSSALSFARSLQKVQGQLNRPLTTIEVRVDDEFDDTTDSQDEIEGTRLTAFGPSQTGLPGKPRPPSRPAPAPPSPPREMERSPGETQFWLPQNHKSEPAWWRTPPGAMMAGNPTGMANHGTGWSPPPPTASHGTPSRTNPTLTNPSAMSNPSQQSPHSLMPQHLPQQPTQNPGHPPATMMHSTSSGYPTMPTASNYSPPATATYNTGPSGGWAPANNTAMAPSTQNSGGGAPPLGAIIALCIFAIAVVVVFSVL